MLLLAMSSMLMIQQYMLNKVFLNRNTHKPRLCNDQLIKMLWPEVGRNTALYFPLGAIMFSGG